ncbi:hypothetical protein VP01_230g10 [Puccinia sorghi]|uniref:Uncharacterized protein n=1 Tax=Puccinia sorghi TaxID=27349 RepID=A0A0L6V8G0_9BASI|nr:hypothetical protein VP01_230g10 [Puccinia sorghi]
MLCDSSSVISSFVSLVYVCSMVSFYPLFLKKKKINQSNIYVDFPQREYFSETAHPKYCQLSGYINFLGICDKENVLNKLIANGFHLHKLFKSTCLLRTNVRGLGLILGVVTVLFDNVNKYEHHLANQV